MITQFILIALGAYLFALGWGQRDRDLIDIFAMVGGVVFIVIGLKL